MDFSSVSEQQQLIGYFRIPAGIKICSPRNKLVWGKQIISNILSNPVYVGTDDYPQIISKEDFDAVQKIKAKNTKCRKK